MSQSPRTPRIIADGLVFPEGPRWHDGAFYFSDMHAHEVQRVEADGSRTIVAAVPTCPSGLGWDPEGRLLVVSMEDHRLLRQASDGSLEAVADFSALATHLSNDMVVDDQGRAYIGNFGFNLHTGEAPKKTNLILALPNGEVKEAADDLSFPNGTVITPDGKTLIVGETFASQLTAFDIEADGSLTNRRTWATLEGAVPDGICLDAEGAIWVASPVSAQVLRVAEGGEVLDRIKVETQAFACMLGGENGKTLFVCTARGSDPAACLADRAGRIEAFDVEVAGAGLP